MQRRNSLRYPGYDYSSPGGYFVTIRLQDAWHLPDAVARCRLAYPDLIGPFLVPDAGHFMQWEQPATVASALRGFFGQP